MAPLIPSWSQPSHPTLIKVDTNPEAYKSGAISLVSLPAGSFFTHIENTTPVSERTYATVQIDAQGRSIDVNSDLVYCNHSCTPSLEFDMHRFEVRVARNRDLNIGDALTFFYPSTEWVMSQPFVCECGSSRCYGWIQGAEAMSSKELEAHWLNDHIVAKLREREETGTSLLATGPKATASLATGTTV